MSMTMIVERSVVDIGNESPSLCGSSSQIRSEIPNRDLELEKILNYSDCESSDLPSSERSSGTSTNISTCKNDHISQYHSIQKLCTSTSSKSEEVRPQSKDRNSFLFSAVNVKTEVPGYHYNCYNSTENRGDAQSDDDVDNGRQISNDQVFSKRQRIGDRDSELFNYLSIPDIQYRPKRKQPQPKHCDEGATLRSEVSPTLSAPKKSVLDNFDGAHSDLQELQKNLNQYKKKYENIFSDNFCKNENKTISFENDEVASKMDDNDDFDIRTNRWESLIKLLKTEVSQNIEVLLDHVVRQFVQRNYQQLNVALQKFSHETPEDDDQQYSTDSKQTDIYENGECCPKSEQINSLSENPLNYSLQNRKDEYSSGQDSYKAYLRHLASSNYKTLYPLSGIQSMIPMFVPPFNPGYMFHNPNVYHTLFYHASQKQQEAFKHDSIANTSLSNEPEQSEAIPLIVNSSKKKRTKVTDSRFSPRIRFHHNESSEQNSQLYQPEVIQNSSLLEKRVSSCDSKYFPKGYHAQEIERRVLSTSKVSNSEEKDQDFYKSHFQAFLGSNPSMHDPDIFPSIYKQNTSTLSNCEDMQNIGEKYAYQNEHKSNSCHLSGRNRSVSVEELKREDTVKFFKDSPRRGLSSTASETSFGDQLMTSTLTPMHLRKAKLMFFYVRYPSSSVLKTYFPDVFFNKNNTAQLIKWFSNFREFYYIQMEKFARQAIAEGVCSSSNLHVSRESELYRILVLHYNRNNRIEVPENFRVTVQATLREFYKAIQAERDQEQSWKKAIYKVIARLDDIIPDHFKRTNWMEELADS